MSRATKGAYTARMVAQFLVRLPPRVSRSILNLYMKRLFFRAKSGRSIARIWIILRRYLLHSRSGGRRTIRKVKLWHSARHQNAYFWLAEIAALDRKLQPWTRPDAAGKKRVNFNENLFAVKCVVSVLARPVDLSDGLAVCRVVGVFDTVGSLGLPEELAITSDVMKTIFGFNDRKLGDYIERAYHAMAINEMRGDFVS